MKTKKETIRCDKLLVSAFINLYLDGFSTEEIGRLMEISQTNVTTRIGRIKEKLRKMVNSEVVKI